MRILKTECSEEQQKKDMPELVQLHAQALQTDIRWLITKPDREGVSLYSVRTWPFRGAPARRKSFRTNDLRRPPSANLMPKNIQKNLIKTNATDLTLPIYII